MWRSLGASKPSSWLAILTNGVDASQQFALMLLDIIDRGDVIDLYQIDEPIERLPRDVTELEDGPDSFSMVCPPSQERKLVGKIENIRPRGAPELLTAFEWKLLGYLDKLRDAAAGGRLAAEAQSSYVTRGILALETRLAGDDEMLEAGDRGMADAAEVPLLDENENEYDIDI